MPIEALNFIAAAHACEMLSEHHGAESDRDEMIRLMISYGPAITQHDKEN
jgi:hypothetical protein